MVWLKAAAYPATLLRCAALVVLGGCWETASASGLFYRRAIPSLLTIARSLAELVTSESFWVNLAVTSAEIAIALGIGGTAGLLCGLIVGSGTTLERIAAPYINGFAFTPKIIFLPIVLLMFGIGVESKIAIGAVACFFPMTISTVSGMRQVNPLLIRVGRSFHLSRRQMIQKIYIPSLFGPINTGLRVSLGFTTVVCILAEFKLSNKGLGFMIMNAYAHSRFSDLYAATAAVLLLATLGNALIDRLYTDPIVRSR